MSGSQSRTAHSQTPASRLSIWRIATWAVVLGLAAAGLLSARDQIALPARPSAKLDAPPARAMPHRDPRTHPPVTISHASIQREATRPTTRLVDDFDRLKARADAQDAAAAAELYRQMLTCSRAAQIQWIDLNTVMASDKAALNPSLSVAEQDTARQRSATHAARLDETSQLCDGFTADLRQALPAVALQAAELGDVDARACYINRGPLMDPSGLIADPSSLTDYAQHAQHLIDQGVSQGDWKVVDLLQFAYSARGWMPISGVTGFDPLASYRYQRLWRLGLTDADEVSQYEQHLDTFRDALRATYTDDQIAEAERWAQMTYDQSFASAGNPHQQVKAQWDACAVPTSSAPPN